MSPQPHVVYGQLVIGPPGSGKTTYCRFVGAALKRVGRNVKFINLDAGNANTGLELDLDIRDIVTSEKVASDHELGPNGALLKSMEIARDNGDWIYQKLKEINNGELIKFQNEYNRLGTIDEKDKREICERLSYKYRPYFMIDCPGQNELYCSSDIMGDILSKITQPNEHYDLRLVCLNLCDSYYVKEVLVYFTLIISSLSSMLRLALPHLNILSKFDKMETYGETRFNSDYYCDLMDLSKLLEFEFESPYHKKHKKFAQALIGVIESYDLVQYHPLDIRNAEQIYFIQKLVDKANGYDLDDLDLETIQLNPYSCAIESGQRM